MGLDTRDSIMWPHMNILIPRILISGGKFLIAIFVFFITIEVCSRLDDAIKYGAPLRGVYSANLLQSKDSEGNNYNLPNARFEKWQHNSLGFRGPEPMQNKPPGTVRVVCMGASESYGLFESPGKEWPAQLQEQLSAPAFEVVNASVVGFNLPLYGPYLKKHVFPLKPDMIILVISPIMYVASIERAAMENSFPSDTAEKSKSQDVSLTRLMLKNIRILPKIKQVIKQSIMEYFPGLLKRYQLRRLQKEVEEIERLRLNGRKPLDSIPDIYLDNFRTELNDLVELIHSQGIEVILTSFPALISHENIGQYTEIFLDNRRFFIWLSLEGMADAVKKLNPVMEHVAREKKAMFFDIASRLPKTTDYFGDNVHFTDRGAKRIAEGVAGQLRGRRYATMGVQ